MPSAFPAKMFQQQTELDNYKLQVELLQEKLQRSEEQRQQLEDKYEKIHKKRTEHEKSIKSMSRLKFEQFLDEQHERNERNKTIIKMLENIDEQAANLASRSERLKILKLQYELYFAKLLQSQAMRSIQNSPRYSMLPVNPILTSPQPQFLYPTMEQQTAAVNVGPIHATIPGGQQQHLLQQQPVSAENWNMMMRNPNIMNQPATLAMNYPTTNELTYRFPTQLDYYNGPILVHPNSFNQIPTAAMQLGIPPFRATGSIPIITTAEINPNPSQPVTQHQNQSEINESSEKHKNENIKLQDTNTEKLQDFRTDSDRKYRQIEDDDKFMWDSSRTPQTTNNQSRIFNENNSNFTESFRMTKNHRTGTNKFNFGKYSQKYGTDDDDDQNGDTDKYHGEFYSKEPLEFNSNTYPSSKSKDKKFTVLESENNDTETLPHSLQQVFETTDVKNDKFKKKTENIKKINETVTNLPEIHKNQTIMDKFESLDLTSNRMEAGSADGEMDQQNVDDALLSQHYLNNNTNNNEEKSRIAAPVMWNFNGRIEPGEDKNDNDNEEILSTIAVPPTKIQFSKKEKLSIENIENAIYGELINPVIQLPKEYNLPSEPIAVNRTEAPPSKSPTKHTPPTPHSLQTTMEFKDFAPENENIVEKLDDTTEKHDDFSKNPEININPALSKQPNTQNAYEENVSIPNQQYPEEYPQNYHEQYATETFSGTQQQQPTTSSNSSIIPTHNEIYQNYEYAATEQTTNNINDYQPQQIAAGISDYHQTADMMNQQLIQDSNIDPYNNQSQQPYENIDYQYNDPNNYSQEQTEYNNPTTGNDYQIDYPNSEYQDGEYDPNAYTYNYAEQQQNPNSYSTDPANQQYATNELFDQQQYSTDPNYKTEILPENYQNYENQPLNDNMIASNQSGEESNIEIPLIETQKELEKSPAQIETINQYQPTIINNSNSDIQKKEEGIVDTVPSVLSAATIKTNVKPILSKEKSIDVEKKKKKVNFVDSSDTDESSLLPKPNLKSTSNNNTDESDFDFSSTN